MVAKDRIASCCSLANNFQCMYGRACSMGNESAPIQLAQCRFATFSFPIALKMSPNPVGDQGSHLTLCSSGLPESTFQAASRSAQLVVQGSWSWPADTQRDTYSRRHATPSIGEPCAEFHNGGGGGYNPTRNSQSNKQSLHGALYSCRRAAVVHWYWIGITQNWEFQNYLRYNLWHRKTWMFLIFNGGFEPPTPSSVYAPDSVCSNIAASSK